MTGAISKMSKGEIFQLQNLYNTGLTRQDYFKYINNKTVSLISACCETGAVMGNTPRSKIKALKSFGNHLGKSFQITDDLLDFTGEPLSLGKPTKNDLYQGNLTLPVIYMLESDNEGEKIKKIIEKRKLTKENLEYITTRLHRSGAVSYTYSVAKEEASKALTALSYLPDTRVKFVLEELTNDILERTNFSLNNNVGGK